MPELITNLYNKLQIKLGWSCNHFQIFNNYAIFPRNSAN